MLKDFRRACTSNLKLESVNVNAYEQKMGEKSDRTVMSQAI